MQGMSWETDAKKAGELYPLIQKNDVEACGQLLEIIERHALGVIRKQLKEYQIYDGELEQEILTEGCVQVYRKMSEGFWVANEQFKPEDTLAYCMDCTLRDQKNRGTQQDPVAGGYGGSRTAGEGQQTAGARSL